MDDIKPIEVIRAAREGRISRRDFNKFLAAAGIGMASMPLTTKLGRAAAEDNPMVS